MARKPTTIIQAGFNGRYSKLNTEGGAPRPQRGVSFSHLYYAMADFTGVKDLLIGSGGAVSFDSGGARFYTRDSPEAVETIPLDKSDISTTNALAAFFDCVRHRTRPFSSKEAYIAREIVAVECTD